MRGRYNDRIDPDVVEMLRDIPQIEYHPLVSSADLMEIKKVMKGLPDLGFPINSAGELIEKLGGRNEVLNTADVQVSPLRMIKYMPSYYFPIASMDNFIEKMAELIRQNRKQVDAPQELISLKQQLPKLKYPIENGESLLRMLGSCNRYRFQGREVDTEKMISRIPGDYFPITSEDDFDMKVVRLMLTRPLIVRD